MMAHPCFVMRRDNAAGRGPIRCTKKCPPPSPRKYQPAYSLSRYGTLPPQLPPPPPQPTRGGGGSGGVLHVYYQIPADIAWSWLQTALSSSDRGNQMHSSLHRWNAASDRVQNMCKPSEAHCGLDNGILTSVVPLLVTRCGPAGMPMAVPSGMSTSTGAEPQPATVHNVQNSGSGGWRKTSVMARPAMTQHGESVGPSRTTCLGAGCGGGNVPVKRWCSSESRWACDCSARPCVWVGIRECSS